MKNSKVKFLTRTGVLLALALVFQMGGFPQFITGPVVNTVLYLATMLVGIWSGVIIGVFTPVIAFVRGILPPPLAPMIPFIAIGNGILSVMFGLLLKKNQVLAIAVASLLKYLTLTLAVTYLVAVPGKIAQAMSFPQLVTAAAGGIIAIIIYKALEAAGIDEKKKEKSLK